MAGMVYYCEAHRFAWPIAAGAKPKGNCPAVGNGDGSSCRVASTDAIGKINDLGLEIAAMEENESEAG